MKHSYKTSGVCSRKIEIELEDGIVKGVLIEGGCHGNSQGISKLVEGQTAEEVIKRCAGIRCGHKNTSCPDQLSIALKEAMVKEKG